MGIIDFFRRKLIGKEIGKKMGVVFWERKKREMGKVMV